MPDAIATLTCAISGKTIAAADCIPCSSLRPSLFAFIRKQHPGLADRIASFGGSWKFIISFGVFIFGWILLNVLILTSDPPAPYPFILLNLLHQLVERNGPPDRGH